MAAMVEIRGVSKTYAGGVTALRDVDLDIADGEILALLGPNGAGKTTLISCICGLAVPSGGSIRVGGHDVGAAYRAARRLIGLVPQEITLEPFETVWNTVRFSRGLFGCRRDDARLEAILRRLSLWDKRGARINALSGGMKRRVLIAKALAHDPRVLFLDEPTAGVDVELRRDMWEIVADLKREGVTIILTTHYIEEAEAIADRIGVITGGRLLLVEEKGPLMRRLGRKTLHIELAAPLAALPAGLEEFDLSPSADGRALVYRYDSAAGRSGIGRLMAALSGAGVALRDLHTRQDSLEDIFVGLVRGDGASTGAAGGGAGTGGAA